MSRNGSGTYTKALPDVIAGDTIEADWANTELDDLETEMTDSLNRSGKGGMLAALKLYDGTVSAPGVAFSNEANSGLYRNAAGDVRFALLGADHWRVTAAGFQQYVSATWVSSVNTAGAQTVAGVKTFSDHVTMASTKGVDWSANTGTAATGAATTSEVLTRYEEGTWTPNLWDDTLSSSESQTYNAQTGLFTRIGRVVHFSCYIHMSALGTLTGNAYIGPLPYTAYNDALAFSVNVGNAANLNITAGRSITGAIGGNGNYIALYLWDDAAGTTQLQMSEISADGYLSFSGHYFV